MLGSILCNTVAVNTKAHQASLIKKDFTQIVNHGIVAHFERCIRTKIVHMIKFKPNNIFIVPQPLD